MRVCVCVLTGRLGVTLRLRQKEKNKSPAVLEVWSFSFGRSHSLPRRPKAPSGGGDAGIFPVRGFLARVRFELGLVDGEGRKRLWLFPELARWQSRTQEGIKDPGGTQRIRLDSCGGAGRSTRHGC